MKRTTAQGFLIASGILALLGGGTCFLAIIPVRLPGDSDGLGMAIFGGLGGLGALVLAAMLFLIGSYLDRRNSPNGFNLNLREQTRHVSDSNTADGDDPEIKQ